MKIKASILLPLFLCGSVLPTTIFGESLLQDVGSCSFMKYYCSARKCNTAFYKAVKKDPEGDCSIKFIVMQRCVQEVIRSCTSDSLFESQIKSIVEDNHNHNVHCSDGSLKITTMLPDAKGKSIMPCNERFANESRPCVETFHAMYGANKADPRLCSQLAKSKKCLRDLIDQECNYTSSERELLKVTGLADYNPFCPSNRDPNATGPEQCAVSQDPTTRPTSQPAHAGTRPMTADLLLAYVVVFGFTVFLHEF